MRYLRTPLFASSVLTAVLGFGCGDDATYVPPPLADAGDDAALPTATTTPSQNPTSALSHTATAAPSDVPDPSSTPTTTAAPQPSDDGDSGIPSATPSTDPSSAPTDIPDAQVTDTGTTPSASSTTVVIPPDGGTPVGGGEPIPEDLYPVTEFDALDGYMSAYFTFDEFENILPDVDEGVASYAIPFDAVAQPYGWGFNLDPSPQDFSGGTLVVRARVASGLTTDLAKPGVLQLFAFSDGGGGAAGYAHLEGNDWQVIEFDLDATGWGNFDAAALTSVAFTFHPDQYNGEVTDADVAAAVIEVDWLGIRPAPVVNPPDGGTPDTGVIDTDGGSVETDSGTVETDSSVVETDGSMVETDSGTVETDSGMTLDGGAVSEGEPIPMDLVPVTEFDTATGYVSGYFTTDTFESITPVVADGIATFTVPFADIDEEYQWAFSLPQVEDFTGGTLVARIRVTGLSSNASIPGVVQLFASSTGYGGAAGWLSAVHGDWYEYEFDLNATGWNGYDESLINGFGIDFHPDYGYPSITNGDVTTAVVEVDWVGVRLP